MIDPKERILRYVSQRDHSTTELERKLRRFYEPDQVSEALAWAQRQSWMPSPQALSEGIARRLTQKGKGRRYIQGYLQQRGLPMPVLADDDELASALSWLKRHASQADMGSRDIQARWMRRLASRGFSSEVCRLALKAFVSDSEIC